MSRKSKLFRWDGAMRLIKLMAVFVVGLGLLVGLGVVIRGSMGTVWSSDRYYVMVAADDDWLRIIGSSRDESRGVELVIPGSVMIPVAGTKGELRANTLWRFGENETESSEIVKRSIEGWLGVNVDSVLLVKKGELGWLDMWRASDGVLMDRMRAFKTWIELRSDQKVSMRIPERLITSRVGPDGEVSAYVDESGLRAWAEDLWVNSSVLSEKVSIEVVNSSSQAGMGRLMEQMVRSGGGLVVSVVSGEKMDGDCVVEAKTSSENQVTISWLRKQLGCELRKGDDDRVVRLYVGEEWARKYTKN